jgi:hypothetical protein
MHLQFWLVRHGETEWSASGQQTERTDLPLTIEGKLHARQIAVFLGSRVFALVLTSRYNEPEKHVNSPDMAIPRSSMQICGNGTTGITRDAALPKSKSSGPAGPCGGMECRPRRAVSLRLVRPQ